MPAATPLVPCLYSTVKNITGKTRSFGFLGIHGATLAPAEEFSEWGDYTSKLQGRANIRKRQAFEVALAGSGSIPASLHLKQSSAAIIFDSVSLIPQMLTLAGGVLGVADPCWGAGY